MMELERASLAQFRKGRNGRSYVIEEDVLDIVGQIQDLDENLKVLWNEYGEHYVVVEDCRDGKERLVTTSLYLDQRLLARLREMVSPGYDLAAEMEAQDAAADREKDHEFHERMGERGEQLAHALRKDLGSSRIIVPKGI